MRRRRAWALCVALVVAGAIGRSPPAVADDPGEAGRAAVEVVAPSSAFVGEAIELRLRVRLDAAFFGAQAVALSRRPLDVPVQVVAPWMVELPGTDPLAPSPAPPDARGDPVTIALGEATVAAHALADVLRDGRTYRVLEVSRRVVARAEGPLVLAAPTLRYAYATRFDDTPFGDRVAVDRRDGTVAGVPTSIRIEALPADGRPAGFAGLVGRYAVEATLDRASAPRGGAVRLTLRLRGEGNLERLDAPRLDALAGFHVLGVIDDRASPARTIAYDLVATADDVVEVAPIPIAFFDPALRGYRTAATAAIPFRVEGTATPPARGPAPADAAPAAGASAAARVAMLCGALVAVLVAGAWIRRARARPRRVAAVDPRRARVRDAASALRAGVAAGAPDVGDLLARLVAARLDVDPAAVVTPDLAARLVARGVPAACAARTAAVLEGLVAARYGGPTAAPEHALDPADVDALVGDDAEPNRS